MYQSCTIREYKTHVLLDSILVYPDCAATTFIAVGYWADTEAVLVEVRECGVWVDALEGRQADEAGGPHARPLQHPAVAVTQVKVHDVGRVEAHHAGQLQVRVHGGPAEARKALLAPPGCAHILTGKLVEGIKALCTIPGARPTQ